MATKKRGPSYRKEAFAHWLNVAFLIGGGIAGAVFDPIIWVLMAPVEIGILWAIPDMPLFKHYTDKKWAVDDVVRERAFYLEQLFGLQEQEDRGFFANLFLEPEGDVDDRVLRRQSREFIHYLEMRAIVAKLREMVHVGGVSITESEIARFEVVINGYLRLLLGCKPLAMALQNTDERGLKREIKELEAKLKKADRQVAPVFRERKKLLGDQLARVPKLKATLELMRTRAEAIVYQLRNIHSHVLSDPGTDVNEVLDDMLKRQEAMIDPVGELAADQMVEEFLSRSTTKAFLDRAEEQLELETHRELAPAQAARAAQAGAKQSSS